MLTLCYNRWTIVPSRNALVGFTDSNFSLRPNSYYVLFALGIVVRQVYRGAHREQAIVLMFATLDSTFGMFMLVVLSVLMAMWSDLAGYNVGTYNDGINTYF